MEGEAQHLHPSPQQRHLEEQTGIGSWLGAADTQRLAPGPPPIREGATSGGTALLRAYSQSQTNSQQQAVQDAAVEGRQVREAMSPVCWVAATLGTFLFCDNLLTV